MIAIAAIFYIGIIVLCYKVFRIKPNALNVGIFVASGFLAIGTIVVIWQFASPSSSHLVVSRYTVQLVPQVKGPIAEIAAKPNVPLDKGRDVLFVIQKDVYEFKLKQAAASLKTAKTNQKQLEAAIRVADAAIRKSKANLSAAEAELTAAQETQKINAGAVAKIRLSQLTEARNAAEAAVEQAVAGKEQAEQALAVGLEQIVGLEAAVDAAKFDLQQCTVYAPADGFVTQWTAREGTMADVSAAASIGTFVDTSKTFLLATFPQNVIKNVKPGDPVEMTFKSHPGEIFTGTVGTIVAATGEGQINPSGKLMSPADWGSSGQCFIQFKADDEKFIRTLALGTGGSVSIYTDKNKPFHIISKVGTRISAWMYYLKPY